MEQPKFSSGDVVKHIRLETEGLYVIKPIIHFYHGRRFVNAKIKEYFTGDYLLRKNDLTTVILPESELASL